MPCSDCAGLAARVERCREALEKIVPALDSAGIIAHEAIRKNLKAIVPVGGLVDAKVAIDAARYAVSALLAESPGPRAAGPTIEEVAGAVDFAAAGLETRSEGRAAGEWAALRELPSEIERACQWIEAGAEPMVAVSALRKALDRSRQDLLTSDPNSEHPSR